MHYKFLILYFGFFFPADEVLTLQGCGVRAMRIGTCIKNVVDKVLKKLESTTDNKMCVGVWVGVLYTC
jgi:hypothetical protein